MMKLLSVLSLFLVLMTACKSTQPQPDNPVIPELPALSAPEVAKKTPVINSQPSAQSQTLPAKKPVIDREQVSAASAGLWPVKGWPVPKLATAAEAEYLHDIEKDVILHLNMARSDPSHYARDFIAPKKQFYKGKTYLEPGGPANFAGYITNEGVKAITESVSVMQATAPMGLLLPSKGLSLATNDHASDQSKTGKTGHNGSDHSDTVIRVKRYGNWIHTIGENIAYGPNTGRDIVVDLLVDDGVPDRGHRKNILNKEFKVAGVSIQRHPQYGFVCVIDFAGGFEDK